MTHLQQLQSILTDAAIQATRCLDELTDSRSRAIILEMQETLAWLQINVQVCMEANQGPQPSCLSAMDSDQDSAVSIPDPML
jgi:hypothetical protein